MYLHGFTTPKIFEYDTLSSEDRWNETFDVIAANPPFMTPKGGIRPHKKFGVQANKAEVLFTDYIAEHLTKNGRAGIVVPNGIIATTQTAYKQLRKMLVDDSLIAVVSLPAGCFMPYSGVKTSILMLDKPLAKKTNHVLFIKVSNDGYDLGAQRREHDKNDLPLALDAFNSYKESISFGKTFDLEKYSSICALVEKEKITDNKDITLSSERYVEGKVSQTEFELFKLGEICDVRDGTHDSPKYVLDGFPLVTSKNIINGKIDFTNVNLISKDDLDKVNKRSYVDDGDLIMPMIGTIGNPIIVKKDREFGIKNVALIKPKENSRINNVYLKYMLGSETINEHFINEAKGVAQKYLSLGFLRDLEIPLPPLEIQEQIVKEIECYQKIIDGAKMVVDNYKPTISIKPEWEMIELGNVCEVNPKKSEVKILEDSTLVSFVPMADLNENEIAFIPKDKKPISEVIGGYTYFKDNDVLVAKVTPCFENGKAGIAKSLENGIGFGSSEFFVLRASDAILPEWIYLNIKSDKFVNDGKKQMSGTSGLQRLPREFVASFPICLPSIEEQQYFIEKMRIEQQIIDSNKLLITLFEQKIKDKINEVWGVKEEVV
jgi:type I restriction enzyme M protein